MNDPTLPTCCIFGDAECQTLLPFLAESFSRLVFVFRPGIDPELVSQLEKPDYVIQQIAERFLIEPIEDRMQIRTDELIFERLNESDPLGRMRAVTTLSRQAEGQWKAPEAYLHLAQARLAIEDIDGATVALAAAEDLDPRWAAIPVVHSQILGKKGKIAEAMQLREVAEQYASEKPLTNRYPKLLRATPLAKSEEVTKLPAPSLSSYRKTKTSSWVDTAKGWAYLFRWPLLCVVLPSLIGLLYWSAIASRRYAVTGIFEVSDQSVGAAAGSALAQLGMSNLQYEDEKLAMNWLRSDDMILDLDKDLGLRKHYESTSIDWISRLGADSTDEKFFRYFQWRFGTTYDDATGAVGYEIQGFDPKYTLALGQDVMQKVEDYLNNAAHLTSAARLNFFEEELKDDTQKFQTAKNAMVDYQNKHGLLDPTVETAGRTSIVVKLEGELAEVRTLLADSLATHGENSQEVKNLNYRIDEINSLIKEERGRNLTPSQFDNKSLAVPAESLNSVLSKWQDLELEEQFRLKVVEASTQALEEAKMEVGQKLKVLEIISAPRPCQEWTYPYIGYDTLTLFLVLAMVYTIGTILAATIREHRD